MKHLFLILSIMACIISGGCTSSQPKLKVETVRKNTPKSNAKTDTPTFYGKFGGNPVKISPRKRQLETRAVWIATVKNLDMHRHQTADSYRKELRTLFDSIASHQVNTVFFQVRSWNDALYPSRLNPWSRWLTGTEGKAIPDLDPLQCALDEARKRHLQFHAWLNPFRVCEADGALSKQQALAQLALDNFARKHPDWVISVPTASPKIQLLILDPGRPQVRMHVLKTIDEILTKYPVDGIHLDDYFYPYEPMGNLDSASQAVFNRSKLPVDEWRRRNIDLLVQGISERVRAAAKRQNRRIEFGISPFGIWANRKNHPDGSLTEGAESYFMQYADSRKWIKNRWVDYIAPQLYWNFGNPVAAFAGLVEWWAAQTQGTGVKLYIGIALFQGAPGRPWANSKEIPNQLEFIKSYPQVKGFVLFRGSFLDKVPLQ